MKKSAKSLFLTLLVLGNAVGACSSIPARTEKMQENLAPETTVDSPSARTHSSHSTFADLPQPESFDLGDLKTFLESTSAPHGAFGEFADTCDEEFRNSKTAPRETAIALVKKDSARMHWCFYSKLVRLQTTLQGESNWSNRQHKVSDQYEFLAPLANAFFELHQDTHYLNCATQYYVQISEWVFFKKTNTETALAKYGIRLSPNLAKTFKNDSPKPDANRSPASVPEEDSEDSNQND